MIKINLKEIVPDLEKRRAKLNTLRKIFMVLTFLIVPAVPAMIVMSKYGTCMALCKAVSTVKMYDKVPITNVLGYFPNVYEAAQKLIDTGNLADYRIVAGAMFVRNDTEMTEEQALREAAACFSIPAAVSAGLTEGGMSRLAKYAAGLQQQAISNAADALPDLSGEGKNISG